jgi:MFS family permease
MDGVGAGIFDVVSVLVIADLTRGTGRFNLTLRAITTAVGIGAALSQVIAGSIVHHVGCRAGFLFLAGVASAAFAILYFSCPRRAATIAAAKSILWRDLQHCGSLESLGNFGQDSQSSVNRANVCANLRQLAEEP